MTSAPLPDHDSGLVRPIIVLGAPRSGTSFISRVLSAHGGVVYVGEPRFTWRYGNDTKSDMLLPADARPDVRNHIRENFSRRVTEGGGNRLLEKSPSNSLRPGFVDAVFPDCLFVHIIRNGVDASVSGAEMWGRKATGIRNLNPKRKAAAEPTRMTERWRELDWRRLHHYAPELLRRAAPTWAHRLMGPPLWGPRLPGLAQMVKSKTLLEVVGLQWEACVRTASEFGRKLPSDRYFELKFEDVNEAGLRALLAYCGLQEDVAPLEYFRDNYRAPRALDVDADQVDRLLPLIEPTMTWLGYSVG